MMYGLRRDCNLYFKENCAYICLNGYDIPIESKFAFLLSFMDGSKTISEVIDTALAVGLVSEKQKKLLMETFMKNCFVYLEIYSDGYIRSDIPLPSTFLLHNQSSISPNCLPLPINMLYHVTDYCDKSCMYCYLGNKPQRFESDMLTFEELLKIIDQLFFCGIRNLIMTGGEPFLRKDIFKILAYASKKGIWSTITTKHYFTEKEAQFLGDIGKVDIGLSYDCNISVIADTLVGIKGHSLKMDKSLKWLLQYGVIVEVQPIVTKLNIEFIDDFLKYLIECGVRKVTFHPYQLLGNKMDSILMYSEDQWDKFCTVLKSYSDMLDINIYSSPHEGFEKSDVSPEFGCRDGTATICMKPNGRVVMCHLMDENEQICYGNLREESLQLIWNKPERKELSNPPAALYKNTCCESCVDLQKCMLKTVCRRQSILEEGNPSAVSSWTREMCLHYHNS